MSWSDWGLNAVYVCGKTAASILIPGSGLAFGVLETAKSICDGDICEAAINGAFTVADAVSFNLASSAKEAAKKCGKEAAILVAKERTKDLGKEAGKKVGKDLSKNLAMGISEEAVKEAWKINAKRRALNMIINGINNGKTFVFQELTEETVQKILQYPSSKASKKMFDPLFKQAFETVAKEEFKKYSFRKFGLDVACTGLNVCMSKRDA